MVNQLRKTVRCSKGHFYDAAKNPNGCPYCASEEDRTEPMGDWYTADDSTIPLDEAAFSPVEKSFDYYDIGYGSDDVTVPIQTPSAEYTEDDVTTGVRFDQEYISVQPVVGWLVGIKGECYGQSYRLKAGRNFIGRSEYMDVSIPGDTSISRERHAILVFEPKESKFFLQPGSSNELFYLNEECVLEVRMIHAYDILSLGHSKLIFIPLCGEQFNWDDYREME